MSTKVINVAITSRGGGDFLTLTLDASVSEQHTGDVEVTDHPVELGADISDHARVKPERLVITGLISDVGINRGEARLDIAPNSDPDAPIPIVGAGRRANAGEAGRSNSGYATLRKFKDERHLLKIITALRSYDNMILENLSVPRDGKSGDALVFTATFKEIRLVALKRALVHVTATVGKPVVDTGKKSTVEADDGPRSYLHHAVVLFGGGNGINELEDSNKANSTKVTLNPDTEF